MVRLDPLDEDMEQTPSQTEDAKERGFVKDRRDEDRGKSDGIDPDDVGDIADEGPAHRR
jgi:hypothetical protein